MSWFTGAINSFASGMGGAIANPQDQNKNVEKTAEKTDQTFKSYDPGITIETKIINPTKPSDTNINGQGTSSSPWWG